MPISAIQKYVQKKKKRPLAGGLLLCKSHFTDLFQHGKSSLLWGGIQAPHSALAWQKHILKEDRWKMSIVCWCCPWWHVQGCGSFRKGSASSAPWGQGFCKPGRHLWEWALGFPASFAHPYIWTCMWHLEMGHSYYYWDFRVLHILFWPLHSFSFLFSFLFSPPCFNQILGTKNTSHAGSDRAYNWQSSSQLNTPDVLPVPKGSHCVRGFLLNSTKQNSKALGLLGCWRETMGKQNSGQRDIYFSEGHGCPYTIPFKALWSFSNTIQSRSQAEIQRVQNLFIPSLM